MIELESQALTQSVKDYESGCECEEESQISLAVRPFFYGDSCGPGETRVCLYDHPGHACDIQAITHYRNHKIYVPPDLEYFTAEGGYNGLTIEDLVRSSLLQDEI